jgi:hypothetical protein
MTYLEQNVGLYYLSQFLLPYEQELGDRGKAWLEIKRWSAQV